MGACGIERSFRGYLRIKPVLGIQPWKLLSAYHSFAFLCEGWSPNALSFWIRFPTERVRVSKQL
jgi:hypothetical protein